MTATPYASMGLVRAISGISTTELSDDEMSGVMSLAVGLFNSEVNIEVGTGNQEYEELIADETSTVVWWTKHLPIADSDGDGAITSADISCYDERKQFNPTSIDVAAITDAKTGKITLAAANDGPVYASYSYSVLPIDSNSFIMAFVYFCASLLWDRLIATAENVSVNGVSVTRRNYFRDRWEQSRVKLLGSAMFAMQDSTVDLNPSSMYFNEPDSEEN
jgi:hypothetical protein